MSEVSVTVTVPNQAAIDRGVPTVTLAGKAWPIPMLAPTQNRVVIPIIEKILFNARAARAAGIDRAMTTEEYDAMALAVWIALTRAHPTLSRAEFDDMPIPNYEMTDAVSVVTLQSGFFKPAAPGAPMLGEASPNP